MQLYYSDSPKPKSVTHSIFLAGPSPRGKEAIDWRLEALEILKELQFDGQVFIPIPEKKFKGGGDEASWNYLNQIQWECASRHLADKIVFWLARDIKSGMPGFTTNIEFGEDLATGKIIYGRPDNADKCRYLDSRNEWLNNPTHNKLYDTLKAAVDSFVSPSLRVNGEVDIPLEIWNKSEFQDWYTHLKLAGNTLVGAKVVSYGRVGNGRLFSYNIHVNIWVESEKRYKSNEFVFFRSNISSILAFYKKEKETYIVLVKEFRSPVNNKEGFVYELPGGSSVDGIGELENAQHELYEETGINILQNNRFIPIHKRQMAATLCAYTSSLYAVELTESEFTSIAQSNQSFGLQDDGEKTYPYVITLNELYETPVDFSTIGMIHEALAKA